MRLVCLNDYEALRIEARYAGVANVIGRAVYPDGRLFCLEPLARAAVQAAGALRKHGFLLVIWDAYRPPHMQELLWRALPDPKFVAPPVLGSNHTRGAALDVSLALPDGTPAPMPTDFDDFSGAAGAYADVPEPARSNRDRLRACMEAAGFKALAEEWWHFDWPRARELPQLELDPWRPPPPA